MSGDKQFQKTFTRRKKGTSSSNNVQKREKETGKGKSSVSEENPNTDEDLVVPSSSAGDTARKVARKPTENDAVGSINVSRSTTQKRKSDGGGGVLRKKQQQPKQKRRKEEKQSQQGEQMKEELKAKPKQKQEGGKKKGSEGEESDLVKRKVEEKEKEKEKKKKKKKKNEEEDEESSAGCRFPVARVDRIIRSEASDYRITHEAVFLINKATEKFLDVFCEDSYKCAADNCKNYVSYNHLSTAVSKAKRLDFLSDYVPEKVKAEKALAERKLVEK